MVVFWYINEGWYKVFDSTGTIGEIVKSLYPRPLAIAGWPTIRTPTSTMPQFTLR